MTEPQAARTDWDVAIVGMACRFPEASDIDSYWANLVAGRESIRRISQEDYLAAGGDPAGLDDPYRVLMAGNVDGIDLFDAEFFGFSRAEAEAIDPQQRFFLECCHHALEHAGCDPDRFGGAIGVYGGATQSEYFLNHIYPRLRSEAVSVNLLSATLGSNPGTLASRVAYKLNLTGPAVSVQTACSTSLVAVHLACQDLLSHRCDAALAGGVTLTPITRQGYRYIADGPFSLDGHCRAFDAKTTGMSPGNGAGVVVLKRLQDALDGGDHVWGVIKGSAINNDGNRKVSFAAPSVQGQIEVILAAQAAADVSADSIGYVEAHGTGTPLGDPIEAAALTAAFRRTTEHRGFCVLGSVKTNIGHLDAAAGVAGLIKAVLVLHHGKIPATLHYRTPNPAIDFATSPFYVNTELTEWPSTTGRTRRAAVTSLGAGGTNAHMILEEAPAIHRAEPSSGWTVLPVSARTPTAVDRLSHQLAEHLDIHRQFGIDDVARTLQTGRRVHEHRRAVVCRDRADAAAALRQPGSTVESTRLTQVVFAFPGVGSHHEGMGHGLYQRYPVYRDELDRAARILLPVLGADLRDVLTGDAHRERPWSFAALVATQYATARTLLSFGVEPHALIGHSLGEYTAACLAGVISFEDVLPLVAQREQLFERAGGATLSVTLSAEDTAGYLGPELTIATVNAPEACAVSGPTHRIDALQRQLEADGVDHHRIAVGAAVHSAMLDPILDDFAAALADLDLTEPRIPVLANLTATWATGDIATPDYWVRHCRETVRFADGLAALHGQLAERGRPVLVEVGPGRTLSRFARQQLGSTAVTVQTMRHPKANLPDEQVLLGAVAALWSHGVSISWTAVDPGPRRRVPLPGYPFERSRYWIDPPATPGPASGDETIHVIATFDAPGRNALPVNFDGELAVLAAAERELRETTEIDRTPTELTALLDRMCTVQICEHLRRNGIDTTPGARTGLDDLTHLLGIVPPYHKYLAAMLDMLDSDGVVTLDPDGMRFRIPPGGSGELDTLSRRIAERFPGKEEAVDLLGRCVAEWDAVLRGEKPGTAVLMPDGQHFIAESVEADLMGHDLDVYVTLTADQIARLARAMADRPLRILEVGAGQGYLSWQLAERLRRVPNVQYHFTDLGRSFVTAARRKARDLGLDFMTFDVLDVSRPPAEQGYAPGSYDVIIALNVLHATPRLDESVGHLHELLTQGGLVFVLETVASSRILTLVIGLFEGWWYFEDGFRDRSPLLSPGQWRQLLTSAGFQPVEVRSHPGTDHCLAIGQRATATAFSQRPVDAGGCMPPRGELEEHLAGIWRDVLGLDQVGVHDNFFDLGGDSLQLLQMASRLRDDLGIDIAIKQLSEDPTIAAIAHRIGELRQAPQPA